MYVQNVQANLIALISSTNDDQLNISCAQITTLEVPHNTDRQEMPVDQTLGVCIAQGCVWYGNSLFDTTYKYTHLNILHN